MNVHESSRHLNRIFKYLIFILSVLFVIVRPLMAAPVPDILTPSDGDTLNAGVSVFFSCTVTLDDPADTVASYMWHSSLQGTLSTEASFSTANLNVGIHTITLQVTDSNDASGTDSISITIENDPPDVEITSPITDSTYDFEELITFRGSVEDPQDGILTGTSLVWTSSQDGVIGSGDVIALDSLLSGEHVITLTATDSHGVSAFDSITIFIGNAPPTASIIAPEDGTSYASGDTITFRGEGIDDEDGTIVSSSLQWTLTATGEVLGIGSVLAVDDLESGTHTVRLTVTDSDGATDTDEIVVIVGNASPVVTIYEPSDNSVFAFGETILLSGGATDLEDGDLTADSLTWQSDISGFLGSGASVSLAELAVGAHRISLIATDSEGVEGSQTITVVVGDEPPTSVIINEPSDQDNFYLNEYIVFQGEAADNEDGELSGDSLVWTSNLESDPIGTGRSFTTNTLSEGEHRITLTATDSSNLSISTYIIITVGNRLPSATITAPADGAVFSSGELITFTGSATDEDEGNLTGSSLVWTTSKSTEAIGTGTSVSVDNLGSGVHIVTLTATDSTGASVSTSITITVENSGPTAEILSPDDGSVFSNGDTITLSGTGSDPEDGELEGVSLVWSLAESTESLGKGSTISVNLESGAHVILLTVTDSEGVTATDSISVVVGQPGTIEILTPADNSSFHLYEPIEFTGEAFDNEDGNLEGEQLVWTSSLHTDPLGTGQRMIIDSLSMGSHIITLTATDSDDNIQRDFIRVTVEGSNSPDVSITSPEDESSFSLGSSITFDGSATDEEDGTLSGASLVWHSSLVTDPLGTGSSLRINTLEQGTHLITLTATDSDGNTAGAFITVTIEGHSPDVSITSPEDESSFSLGASITFNGSATDEEDGTLSGASLVWRSSLVTDPLGTGSAFRINTLEQGTHLITLTATDSDGNTAGAFITVTIEGHSPDVSITSPEDESSFSLGESITFNGSAADEEDGTLSGASLVWSSSLVTDPLGTGTALRLNSLEKGTHLITLTATDSDGNTADDFITVTIDEDQTPTVTISAPEDGSSFYLNESIELEGSATDTEDGTLTGDSLVWTSNIETGVLGTGETALIDTLSPGNHLITLTATDSSNISGLDFILITVENRPPVPVITSPETGSSVDEGDEIVFSGYATDPEDGSITGNSLTWISDLDGFIGSGVRFSNSLSQGEHVISLTAKDKYHLEATTSIQLTVDATDSSDPMSLETPDVTVALGQTTTIGIIGGYPPFRWHREYPYIATLTIENRTIEVIPEVIGESTFQIIDHDNTFQTLHLTVTDTVSTLPVADAGVDQTVVEGSTVTLDGTETFSGSYGIASWHWEQISGRDTLGIVLSDETASKTTFVAPSADILSGLSFRLTVIDQNGTVSFDDVTVNVLSNDVVESYPQEVVSFLTADQSRSLGVALAGDGDFVAIDPEFPEFIPDSGGKPENMIYGVVDLKIKVDAGAQADMLIYFPEALGEEYGVYKYSPADGWYDYSDFVSFSSDRTRAFVIVVDGSVGDDDGVADGIISDPITVGTEPISSSPSSPTDPDDSSSGGGGGCFISTLLN